MDPVPKFHGSATLQAKTVAKKSARLKTFPDCLLLSLSKYQMDQNWQPVKLNVEVRRTEIYAQLIPPPLPFHSAFNYKTKHYQRKEPETNSLPRTYNNLLPSIVTHCPLYGRGWGGGYLLGRSSIGI
jgi:hypothetical protein